MINDNLFCKEDNPGGLYGWICPICGAVMSPYTSCCVNCGRNFEITYVSTTTETNTDANDYNYFINDIQNGKLPPLNFDLKEGIDVCKYGWT